MSDANLNQLWARALVEELVRGGVRHAVVCPGSRSSPLALACAQVEGLRAWSIIDERGAGFFALGLAKQSRQPVALVCTSGTAGAHFYPAVIEAAMAQVPLVILTADRPLELQGWGAPQTVPQARLYGEYARQFVDVGLPEASDAALLHLRATVSRAVGQAARAPRGAVHLNVPLREPLAPLPGSTLDTKHLSPLALEGRTGEPLTRILPPSRQPNPRVLDEIRARILATERGVIVCGPRDEDDGFGEAIAALAEATGYPVLAEATSQARFGGGPFTVSLYDAILRHEAFARAHRPELVLRFGGGLTPKGPQAWVDDSGAEVVLFSDEGALFDPAHRVARVVEGSAVMACAALASGLARGMGAWARAFLWAEQWSRASLESAFSEDMSLTEMRIAYDVVAALPEGAHLFVSSSMPIRDVDAFAPATRRRLRVLANRGANGIDGIVSSALGVAAASRRPTVLLTGDLALLHDVGGLLTARRAGVPLTVVVVNNDGGGIFSFLPLAKSDGAQPHYEALWGTPARGGLLARRLALPGTLPASGLVLGAARGGVRGAQGRPAPHRGPGARAREECGLAPAAVRPNGRLTGRGPMALKLAYETWGEGTHPLLLLHGFTGNRSAFDHLRPLLGRTVSAIAVDLPGHGQTPLPARTGREGFLETVDALLDVLDALGVQKANLLGYSQGARFALAAALARPERFGRLIMESGSPGLHRRQERTERRAKDAELATFIRQRGVEAFVEHWESLPLFDGPARAVPRAPAHPARAASDLHRGGAGGGAGLPGPGRAAGLLAGAAAPAAAHAAAHRGAGREVHADRAPDGGGVAGGVAPHVRRRAATPPTWKCPRTTSRRWLAFLRTPWYESPEFDTPPDTGAAEGHG